MVVVQLVQLELLRFAAGADTLRRYGSVLFQITSAVQFMHPLQAMLRHDSLTNLHSRYGVQRFGPRTAGREPSNTSPSTPTAQWSVATKNLRVLCYCCGSRVSSRSQEGVETMDIMMMLEGGALTAVYECFRKKLLATGDGLSMTEFVKTMFSNVPGVESMDKGEWAPFSGLESCQLTHVGCRQSNLSKTYASCSNKSM